MSDKSVVILLNETGKKLPQTTQRDLGWLSSDIRSLVTTIKRYPKERALTAQEFVTRMKNVSGLAQNLSQQALYQLFVDLYITLFDKRREACQNIEVYFRTKKLRGSSATELLHLISLCFLLGGMCQRHTEGKHFSLYRNSAKEFLTILSGVLGEVPRHSKLKTDLAHLLAHFADITRVIDKELNGGLLEWQ